MNDEPISMSDPFAMAPLYPTETGLPMTVWVRPRSRVRADVRIVVNGVSGPRPTIAKPKIVAVRPTPRVISGHLPLVHRQLVFDWVWLNQTALADYWAGAIGTIEFARRLRPLPINGALPIDESHPEQPAAGDGHLADRAAAPRDGARP